jgi:hypothetical protein
MTLFTAPVGYSVAYTPATATTFQGERKVNPHKDSVFIDPRTGELTTIKPGIYDPDKEEKKGKGGLIALGAAVVTAALAFVFRGKIKNIPFVKNTVIPAVKNGWTAVKGFAGKAWTATKTYAGKAYNAVKNVATKAWDAVKNFFKKAPAAAGGAVPTP